MVGADEVFVPILAGMVGWIPARTMGKEGINQVYCSVREYLLHYNSFFDYRFNMVVCVLVYIFAVA